MASPQFPSGAMAAPQCPLDAMPAKPWLRRNAFEAQCLRHNQTVRSNFDKDLSK
jgi:hypothetical protein